MSVFPEHYELIERIKAKDPALAEHLEHAEWLQLLPYIHDWTRFYQQSLVHQLKEQMWDDRNAGRVDEATERYLTELLQNTERHILSEYNEPAEPDPEGWKRPA